MEYVYVDGSFCGKAKKYGAGVYKQRGLTDDSEQTFSGECLSSSDAEFNAILHGLQVALESGFEHVSIMNDCESVMLECNDLLKGKAPETLMSRSIKDAIGKFITLRFIKIPREENKAHALSKIALRELS